MEATRDLPLRSPVFVRLRRLLLPRRHQREGDGSFHHGVKTVKGLYFAGELLDLDAVTGGLSGRLPGLYYMVPREGWLRTQPIITEETMEHFNIALTDLRSRKSTILKLAAKPFKGFVYVDTGAMCTAP